MNFNRGGIAFLGKRCTGTCWRVITASALLLEGGADIRTVQEQLRYQNEKTTEIYTHALKRGARGVPSLFGDLVIDQ